MRTVRCSGCLGGGGGRDVCLAGMSGQGRRVEGSSTVRDKFFAEFIFL